MSSIPDIQHWGEPEHGAAGRPRLFKHGKIEHLEMLRDSGVLRLGALIDYQKKEKHTGKVLDEAEGVVRYTADDYRVGDGEETEKEALERRLLRDRVGISIEHDSRNFQIIESFGQTQVECFTFCVTERDDAAFREEGYNGMIEITDPSLFYDRLLKAQFTIDPEWAKLHPEAITRMVQGDLKLRFRPFAKCLYTRRTRDFRADAVVEYLVKGEEYVDSKEWRIFFKILDLRPQPDYITARSLGIRRAVGREIIPYTSL